MGTGKSNDFEELVAQLRRGDRLIGRSHTPYITVDIDLSIYELSVPATISRHHAVIQWANNKLQIIDLNSRNGTFVNGQQATYSSVYQSALSPCCANSG